jgi:NTE family protein
VDTILVFQGGGSLGAYECGVYQALAPWLRAKGHRLDVVAGTSIGAINAGIVAAHWSTPDHGVAALRGFWSDVKNDAIPFLPPIGQFAAWNAVWTSLLLGNPRLFRPTVPFWTLMPPVTWAPFKEFYDTEPMEATLQRYVRPHGPKQSSPQLIVTAVDLDRVKPVAFDSWKMAVTPRHILASCSLPPTFPATKLDGSTYWDGGLWSNTPLRDALKCIQEPDAPARDGMSDYLVFVVDLFAPAQGHPAAINGNWDVWALRDRVLFQDKGEYDERAAAWVNLHIAFVRKMQELVGTPPAPDGDPLNRLRRAVDREATALRDERRLHLEVHRIVRSDPGSSDISREIDFSPGHLSRLIEQGQADTLRSLADI